MNVTLSLFQGVAGGAGEATATLGSGSESLVGQQLGATNPFALLLNGQLQGGRQGAGAQGLPMTLAQATPVAALQTLPAVGKPLPDTVVAGQAQADVEPGGDPAALLPLSWSMTAQPVVREQDSAPGLRTGSGAELSLTGNIMKLALGGGDGQDPEAAVATAKPGFEEQVLLRAAQPGVLRVEAERAAALTQADATTQSGRNDAGNGAHTGAPSTAALPELARAADAQRATPVAQPQPTLSQPLGKPGWDQDLGSRLVWMSKHNLDSAQLRLNPAHLGPLEVRLSVQQDQTASVTFLSNHAPVREAVEAALPRLREMLADSGVALNDVNVSSQSRGRSHEQDARAPQGFAEDTGDMELSAADETERVSAIGLVDYFA